MPKLHVVICSTRPNRLGQPVAEWFLERARAHGRFEVELVDLKEINLPAMDEPRHPRLQQYEHDHTKQWSAKVAAADAFVFVTPEYNYGLAPALVNALDYLYREWNYKPAGFVSYGGVSAGTRSAQMAKQIMTTLRMMPIPEGVSIPFIDKLVDANRVFTGGGPQENGVKGMLEELFKWSEALRPLRSSPQ